MGCQGAKLPGSSDQVLFKESLDQPWMVAKYNRRKFRSQTSDNMER